MGRKFTVLARVPARSARGGAGTPLWLELSRPPPPACVARAKSAFSGQKVARPRGVRIAERVHCFECPEDCFENVPLQHIVDNVLEIILGALKAVNAFCDSDAAGPRNLLARKCTFCAGHACGGGGLESFYRKGRWVEVHADPHSANFVCQKCETALQTSRCPTRGLECRANHRGGSILRVRMAILTPRGRATFWPGNALFARRCDGAVARSAPDTKSLSPKAHFPPFSPKAKKIGNPGSKGGKILGKIHTSL